MFEDFGKQARNECAVFETIAADVIPAIVHDLREDLKDHPGSTILKSSAALGVGIASGIAMGRCPLLSKIFLTTVGVTRAMSDLGKFAGIANSARFADTEDTRGALAQTFAPGLARDSASALETAPAFLAGHLTGFVSTRFSRTLGRLSYWAAENLGLTRASEVIDFMGPGTGQLPKTLINADGTLNVWGQSEMLARGYRWKGAERAWYVRESDLKIGHLSTGNSESLELPYPNRGGYIMTHTHPEQGLSVPDGQTVLGSRPSIEDIRFTSNFGLIQSGKRTTLYMGAAADHAPGASGSFNPELKAIVLDLDKKIAARLESQWSLKDRRFLPAPVTFLDFAETQRVLSNWDRTWSSIKSIPSDPKVFNMKIMELGIYGGRS